MSRKSYPKLFVSPIGELNYRGNKMYINDGKIGALTQKLYDELTGIQLGTKPDPYGWTRTL